MTSPGWKVSFAPRGRKHEERGFKIRRVSMAPERGPNPYAPPQSEVTPHLVHALPLTRPTSTKLTIFVLAVISMGWLCNVYEVVVNANWNKLQNTWQYQIRGCFCLSAFFTLLIYKATRSGFLLGAISLAWIAVSWSKWVFARTKQIGSSDPVQASMLFAVMLLLFLLFYRFTFGLPSRKFYQNTKR